MGTAHKDVLVDILGQFKGKSPDDIAAMVKRRGIKGRMGTTHRCPMALLLDGISTGQYMIGRKYIARRSGETIEKARTPENLSTFVRKFDVGGYPDLIAPPPRCLANEGTAPKRKHGRSGVSGAKKRGATKHHIAKMVGRFH